MSKAPKSLFRSFYVFLRDKRVEIMRGLILLCGFAALGLVLFGRDVWTIIQVVAIGSAFLIRYEIWH